MEWEVHRDPEHRTTSASESPPWTTRLSLSMPRLGQINAQLSLSGNTLNIALTAPAGDPVAELKTRSDELSAALDAVGIRVRGLQIQNGPA